MTRAVFMRCLSTGAPESPPTLAAELTAFNGRWLDEVRRHLSPACDPHAGFWDRWAAVRYLADHFEEPYRRAGDLLDALLDHLDPRTAGRLVDDWQAIDHLRVDFNQIGRSGNRDCRGSDRVLAAGDAAAVVQGTGGGGPRRRAGRVSARVRDALGALHPSFTVASG